jgi:CBS domain-containing protein
MQAEAIMSQPVVCIDPTASIAEAAALMLFKKISGLPVVDRDGRLVGIVSEGDFLRRRELGTLKKRSRWLEFIVTPGLAAVEYVHGNGRRIEEVMSHDVVGTSPAASLAEIVELMSHRSVKRIPVVDGGKVVGIVTRSDIVRALLGALPDVADKAVEDERIRRSIVNELAAQKWARKGLIDVVVNDGTVKLSGAIFDERERLAARVAAENVAGVRAVEDHLFCADPLSVILVS